MISPYKSKFKVTQIYKGANHKGLDLVGLDDKNIYSTVDGIIELAGWDTHPTGGMGLYIRIRENGTARRFYFAHLSAVSVKVGQTVKQGDLIGVEGSTGHSSGTHLHYEVRSLPDNTTFLNISDISGIPNKLGMFGQEEGMEPKELTASEAAAIVKDKAGLDDKTIDYLANDYKYGKDLIVKLAKAMK
ncbi:MAG: Membrane protein related to metalloendopeptidase [Sporomusa sp.]|jgi:murein DD-endopeptidase MepM/ murein hydrolase activator NlpD|nr:Membrane protein related to metalloendopeptidase [Sporomusa sp.]